MTCNICDNAYGFTFGCDCSFLMCEECSKKHLDSKKKDECPQCRKSLKIKNFFSGKINNMSPNRLFVYNDQHETKNEALSGAFCSKHGIIKLKNDKQLITYSKFNNANTSLPVVSIDNFNITTGPCVLINHDLTSGHGYLNGDYESDGTEYLLRNVKGITNIVYTRNTEMIHKCNVFVLSINNDNDCFCSYSEWGQALVLKKILILNINKENKKLKEYHMYAIQSIQSLEKLKFTKREFVIRFNPEIDFNDYISYKKFMLSIINLK